jgi:hypothetical protein
MKPRLKAPGSKRLKLKCDILLSTSAFKFNLRRYSMGSLFFMMLYLTLMSLSSLPVWREDRLLFLRERANRVYGRETLNPKP